MIPPSGILNPSNVWLLIPVLRLQTQILTVVGWLELPMDRTETRREGAEKVNRFTPLLHPGQSKPEIGRGTVSQSLSRL